METNLPLFSVWNERLGKAIQDLGAPAFCSRMSLALNSVLEFDYFAVYGYVNGVMAKNLFNNYPAHGAGIVDEYIDGRYKRDPLFRRASTSGFNDLISLRGGPDRELDRRYFDWYEQVGLGDEIGFGYRMDDSTQIILSVARRADQRHFVPSELNPFRSILPTVLALAARQWVRVGDEMLPAQAVGDADAARAAAVRKLPLTSREIEIVEYVLKGYSSETIAANLAISLGTVKVHRRNIYQKLKISSQVELFHLCLTPVSAAH